MNILDSLPNICLLPRKPAHCWFPPKIHPPLLPLVFSEACHQCPALRVANVQPCNLWPLLLFCSSSCPMEWVWEERHVTFFDSKGNPDQRTWQNECHWATGSSVRSAQLGRLDMARKRNSGKPGPPWSSLSPNLDGVSALHPRQASSLGRSLLFRRNKQGRCLV